MTSLIATALTPHDPSPLHPVNKAAIFDALEAAGIAYVEVPFHGSGDEGFVGEPTAYLRTGTAETPHFTPIDLPTVMIGWSRLSDDGKETIIDRPLSDALDDATWDCSYATSHSWEDHDGAEGTVTFLCGNRSIEVDMAQFYMESNSLLKTF